jgi:sterol desaturase/sphingolipid hydroxylase (fatty acid hydroxylase superfamily)
MVATIFNTFLDLYTNAQSFVYEVILQPLAFKLSFGGLMEDGFEASGWLVAGFFQLIVILTLLVPLEFLKPVEPIKDKGAVNVDIIYTLIHRLGLFRLFFFFTVEPFYDDLFGTLHSLGLGTFQLDDLLPGVTDIGWVSFLIYIIVFDFIAYWIHRAQHQWGPWWALHALHHSQQQMTVWSDDRNHLLDDLIVASIFTLVALVIGIEPSQYVALIALTKLSESVQHANFKSSFGFLGKFLWVSPQFHRQHHSIGIGHEFKSGVLGGHNFGVLLPVWDRIFKTSFFQDTYPQTGIRDQIENGINYGVGFWAQQWLGIVRFFKTIV